MTLQQLQYIIAVDQHRHFVKAAEACSVTQSTLSSMIKSLEKELNIVIFDRKSYPVQPTELGRKIIDKARVILHNAGELTEMVAQERGCALGKVSVGIIPTVSPYLLPKMVANMKQYEDLEIHFSEAGAETLISSLKKAEIDVALLATPLKEPGLLEIPLYHENFYAYVSPLDPLHGKETLQPSDLPGENLWVLQEGHCFRNQIAGFCALAAAHSAVYESGSIDTLLRIIDLNGGHTIIPQMHLQYLTDAQRNNVRQISSGILGNGAPVREISMVIREDFVRERLLNILLEIIKPAVPEQMLAAGVKNYPIKL